MNRTALVLTMLLGMAALPGCVTPIPATTAPSLYDGKALGLSGPALAPAATKWWAALGDSQLDQLLDHGLVNSPTLSEAAARLRAARTEVIRAHADVLPGLDASGEGGYGRSATHYLVPPPIAGHVGSLGDVGASLSWSLDVWGRVADQEAAARAEADARSADLAQARLLLAGAMVQAYIDYQRAYTLAQLADAALVSQQRLLGIYRLRADAGLDTRLPQASAERQLPQWRQLALRAHATVELTQHALLTLSGQSAGAGLAEPHLDLGAGLAVPAQLPVNLLARRPDIIAARLRVQADMARQREAVAAFYPSVNLQALAGYASFDISNLFSGSSRNWNGGAAIALPIFDAGRLRAGEAGAEAVRDADIAAYNGTVLQAVQQSLDQLTLITALGAERQQQALALAAAEKAWQLSSARAAAQLDSQVPALLSNLDRIEAQRADTGFAADMALAQVRLLIALGGSFDPSSNLNTVALQP